MCEVLTDGEILVLNHVSFAVSLLEYEGLVSLGACFGWTREVCHERGN